MSHVETMLSEYAFCIPSFGSALEELRKGAPLAAILVGETIKEDATRMICSKKKIISVHFPTFAKMFKYKTRRLYKHISPRLGWNREKAGRRVGREREPTVLQGHRRTPFALGGLTGSSRGLPPPPAVGRQVGLSHC